MTAADLNLPDGFTAVSDGNGGWRISRAGIYIAHLFPRLTADPGGLWYARPYSKPAQLCRDRQTAVDRITRHFAEETS
jgi:hypothetical protein